MRTADAQTDLSLAGRTNHFVDFVMRQVSRKLFETIRPFNETIDAETFA